MNKDQKYNEIREFIADLLIEYDRYIMETHTTLIAAAKLATQETPFLRLPEQPDYPPVDVARFLYSTKPVFRLTVDQLASYVMANIKDSE